MSGCPPTRSAPECRPCLPVRSSADVDWGGGGVKIEALIDIRLRPGADDAAFERAAVQLPGAVELDHLAGLTHYCLRASVPTMDALDELIRELKEKLGAHTTTKIITRTLRKYGASPGR